MPIVVAHAGGSAHAPANTFGAYRKAHAAWPGVWMELDGQFSSDGELMAIHDDTLDRTTNWTGHVADRTASELQGCDASGGWPEWGFEPIPLVRDMLTEGRDAGWRLILEIKNIPGQRSFDPSGERYAAALEGVLRDTDFPADRLVVICFWAPTLDAIKAVRGDVALGYLTVPQLPRGPGLSATQNLDLCVERGYHVSAPRHTSEDLSAEHVERAHDRGVQVHVWTANEPDEIDRAVSCGLDGITSDHPDRVFAALG
jgi:glycerophosphoryl diester phosphodiesterase